MPVPDIKVIITGFDRLSNKLAKPMKTLDRFGSKLRKTGRSMTMGLTVPIALFGASTLKTAGQYELSMNRVQNLTRATASEFQALQKQARHLGATTIYSASQSADAMGFLAMAGFNTKKIMGALPATLNLASAGQMELAETADKLSNIMTQYGKKANEATFTTDQLVYTANNANTNVSQLAEAMVYAGTIAHGMNIPFEQTTAALGLLGNAGIQASMAGTTLRGALAKLSEPSGKAIAVMNRLGIRRSMVQDSEGNISSLIKVVQAFEEAGASASDMMTVFGLRAGPGMVGLVAQGSKALTEFSAQVKGSAGTAQEAADVMNKGLFGQLKALRSAFEELQLAISDAGILAFVTKLTTKLTKFVRKMGEANPALLRWGMLILAVVAAVGPLLIIVGAMLTAISKIIIAVKALSFVLTGVSAIMTFLAANPIVLIIGGIVALVAAIIWMIKNWDKVVKAFKVGWAFLVKYWKVGAKVMLSAIFPLYGLIMLIIKNFDKIKEAAKGVARFLMPKALEHKLGLTPPAESREVPAMRQEYLQKNVNENKVTATLDIKNVPPGSTVQVDEGDMDISMDTGLVPVGVN